MKKVWIWIVKCLLKKKKNLAIYHLISFDGSEVALYYLLKRKAVDALPNVSEVETLFYAWLTVELRIWGKLERPLELDILYIYTSKG